MGYGNPSMPDVKMPPPPPPPAPMDQPDVKEAELAGAQSENQETKKVGSKRKSRVYNKRQKGSSSYKGGGLNAV